MWLMTNTGFYSAIQFDDRKAPRHEELASLDVTKVLLVRTRNEDSVLILSAFVGGREFTVTPTGDYRFRVQVTRAEWSAFLTDEANEIDYGNFKSSVKDNALHNAYMGVWGVMHKIQPPLTPRTKPLNWPTPTSLRMPPPEHVPASVARDDGDDWEGVDGWLESHPARSKSHPARSIHDLTDDEWDELQEQVEADTVDPVRRFCTTTSGKRSHVVGDLGYAVCGIDPIWREVASGEFVPMCGHCEVTVSQSVREDWAAHMDGTLIPF